MNGRFRGFPSQALEKTGHCINPGLRDRDGIGSRGRSDPVYAYIPGSYSNPVVDHPLFDAHCYHDVSTSRIRRCYPGQVRRVDTSLHFRRREYSDPYFYAASGLYFARIFHQ